MLEVTVLGKYTQYIGICVTEERQIREALMLSTAELCRKLHENRFSFEYLHNRFSFENEVMG